MSVTIGKSNLGDMLPSFIIILIVSLFLVFAIYMVIKTSKAKKYTRQDRNKELELRNASIAATFLHFTGLPIPEASLCKLYSTPKNIQITVSGQQFNLAKTKILDITIKTDVDMQKSYTSSAGGAVGGAILFGAVGALIGGRVKEKKIMNVHSYLIFTYQTEKGSQYIAFDVTGTTAQADKFVKEFATYKTAQTKVFDI